MLRKLALFALMTALFCSRMLAQNTNSNTVTVTVVAPSSWTITVSPMAYAQNTAKAMTITVTAGPVTNACTATWDALSLPLSFPANLTNPVALTASVTAAMTATAGPHSIFITCPQPVLTLNSPSMLPNGKVGTAYSASLATTSAVKGGVAPYSWTCSGLPTGLSCASSGAITGTPSSAGLFTFGFTVKDATAIALLPLVPKIISGGA